MSCLCTHSRAESRRNLGRASGSFPEPVLNAVRSGRVELSRPSPAIERAGTPALLPSRRHRHRHAFFATRPRHGSSKSSQQARHRGPAPPSQHRRRRSPSMLTVPCWPTPQPDAVSSAASYISLYVARASLARFRSRLAHCASNFHICWTKRRDWPNPTCALKIEIKGHHGTLSRRLELPLTALGTAWTSVRMRVSFFKLKVFK